MAITRRQFIKRTGLAAAGTLLGPSLFGNPFVRQALADTIGDRYFVVLFLDGGNDGLNTVMPVTTAAARCAPPTTATARTGARRDPASSPARRSRGTAIGSDRGHAARSSRFHPGLGRPASSSTTLGKVAVIQGCGYPDYSLSHEESRDHLADGEPARTRRYAAPAGSAATSPPASTAAATFPASASPASVAPASSGRPRPACSPSTACEDFGFPYDDFDYDERRRREARRASRRSTTQAAGERAADSQLPRRHRHRDARSAARATRSCTRPVRRPTARSPSSDAYDDRRPQHGARPPRDRQGHLRRRAPGASRTSTRASSSSSNGGYDTHSDQGGGRDRRPALRPARGGRRRAQGLLRRPRRHGRRPSRRAASSVWSEFSRRIPQNDNGTDHGSQGPMFVIGGAVNGGVYGNHPEHRPAALDDDGNTVYSQDGRSRYRSTDFRDVYGTILKHWRQHDARRTSWRTCLPVDGRQSRRTTGRRANFDLGFLP